MIRILVYLIFWYQSVWIAPDFGRKAKNPLTSKNPLQLIFFTINSPFALLGANAIEAAIKQKRVTIFSDLFMVILLEGVV